MRAALTHTLAFAFLVATLTLAGDLALPERVRRICVWARWATAFALGTGFSAVAFTLAAAAGVLTVRLVWGLQAVITLAALIRVAALIKSRAQRTAGVSRLQGEPRLDPVARMSLVPLSLIALATFVATLAPPSSQDAMVYHLRVPSVYLVKGHWTALYDVVQSFQPAYVEMAFGHGMALDGELMGALVHWGLGMGAAVAAGAWALRVGGSPLTAALLVAGTPLFVWEATGAFIDLGLALFGSLAIYWASRTEAGRWGVVLAGLLGGLAAGSKLTGGALAALAGGTALVAAWPRRRLALGRLVAIGAIALALVMPWYLHNVATTGNPFYPVGNRFLGIPQREIASEHYGYGHTLLDLLRSPFDLIWRGGPFDQGWSVGPALLALVPLGAFAGRRLQATRLVMANILAFWVFWFYSMPQTRLLLPIFPLGAALASAAVESARMSPFKVFRAAVLGIFGLSTLVGLVVALLFARTYAPAALGIETRDNFLTRMSSHYPAFAAANERLPAGARVAVSGANNLYHLRRECSTVEANAPLVQLRQEGFTHVLAITECDKPRPGGRALWSGRYSLPVSRIKGGAGAARCASLEQL